MTKFTVFDVTGPIMVGPSSSHTAGAARLGKVARKLIGDSSIKKVTFYLHGSFAKTYKGHGTDKALLAGILGFETYDERLKDSFNIATSQGIEYDFIPTDLGDVHTNTVKFHIVTNKGVEYNVVGCSIGGGKVVVTEVDGISVNFTGNNPIIITKHKDKPGIIAKITSLLYDEKINIGNMSVSRDKIEGMAMMYIEIDTYVGDSFIEKVKEMDEMKKVLVLTSF